MSATPYDKTKNKAVLFFSSSSRANFQQLIDYGIGEVLVSYYYMKKSLKYFTDMMHQVHDKGGIFLTDSGAFSFMVKHQDDPEAYKESFWIDYLHEYVDFLRDNKDVIYAAANLDLDTIVGRDVVDRWNREYFEPLEKEGLHVIYVAHEDYDLGDPHAIYRFTEYCQKYKYVGINQLHKKYAAKYYQIASIYKVRVHGFAWTELNILKSYPFFSCDSVTWLGGIRFGTTYDDDGKNFRTIDYKHKYRRKARELKYRKNGLDVDLIKKENLVEINKLSLLGWMGFRREYLKIANLKLTNKMVSDYE